MTWRKHGTYRNRRTANAIAKMLRAPGDPSDPKLRARVKKEIYWRVDYLERP